METNPFNDRILTLGFCLSIIPEVLLECAVDTATWIAQKVDDALVDSGPED